MQFNFFFISYSVIYAKYNHCYEIPRDLPIRYFDGKEWVFVKPRHIFRTKAPRYTKISTELECDDFFKEIELQDTTTQIPPTCGSTKTKTKTLEKTTTKTATTKKTTTERTTTEKTTTKKTTTKKITTKMTTPKTTLRKVRPTKTAVKLSPYRCKLKLKTTTTTTIDPQTWQTRMLPSENWINAWSRGRPTKKRYPVGQSLWVDPSHCKLKLETTTATTIVPLIWQIKTNKMITSQDWINIWTRVRPTKKPPETTKKYTSKNLLATRTKKPAKTTKKPATATRKPATLTKAPLKTTKQPVRTTEKPVQLSGTFLQGDGVNGPEKWSNLMREFLKFVELKKCPPPCEYGTRTTMPFSEYLLGNKIFRSGADDLTNILMDGVKIDDKLSKIEDDTSQGKALMLYKETYEVDRGQRSNYDSGEGSVSRDSKMNNDNVQDLDLKPFKKSVTVRLIKQDERPAQYRKKTAFLKELKSKNVKQDEEEYFDELKAENAINEDKIIKDSEINSYLSVLKQKHTIKEKDSDRKAYLENDRHTRKAQDTDIRKRLDAIKDIFTQRYEDNSQYVSEDPLNFKELNRISDYVATKRSYSTEMKNDNEDFLQDRDITFDLGTLEDDHVNADNLYSTESIEVRDSDIYAYADTVNDINEQKDDKTIKSYENFSPLFNFKYALFENVTK